VARLARLVDGLLTLARADASRPAPVSLDLETIVAARADAWSVQLAARGIVMDVRVSAETTVLATPGVVEQVLDNLISNPLAVSQPGGTIAIEAGGAGDEVRLRVRDHGPGMTAEQRSRAFDRFWRAGSKDSGTGLGLPIVHRLVTSDGGTAELLEVATGGLEVVITLPAGARSPAGSRTRRTARVHDGLDVRG
jgi:signal transduction histidine kinase